jgi:ABC-type transporter Mla MlaB component
MTTPIDGELSFARMPALLRQLDAIAASGELDAARVTRVDSAGLAYLLELTRRARLRHADFVIRNASPALVSLARFFGLVGILRFESSGDTA